MTKQQMLELIVYKLGRLKVPDLQKISTNIFDDLQKIRENKDPMMPKTN